jgi:phage-related minor tail protein
MKGLYGNDETNVLADIKTRLGQRIADQVKNKQEEHEMILSAFNELPEDMIERAIKENRVDELSTEVATKALENYKTQFGTEGLSGIMIASVDENKFKQEVAKLIEPAIKDITTKMDEKLKQVQDAVSGGVNPTA